MPETVAMSFGPLMAAELFCPERVRLMSALFAEAVI